MQQQDGINELGQGKTLSCNEANLWATSGVPPDLTSALVLQLKLNKRQISMDIGQQRGGAQRVIHKFSWDLFSSHLSCARRNESL